MTNYFEVMEAQNDGPIAFTATVSDNLAAGINDGTYSFVLVAWDDPEEKDISRARYQYQYSRNPQLATSLTYYSRAVNVVVNTTPDNQGKITFAWIAPRRLPHHYSLYYQTGATFSTGSIGSKIIPATGTVNGDIPGTATSCVITNLTARSHTVYGQITDLDTSGNRVFVRGNYSALLLGGTSSVTEFPSGTSRSVTQTFITFNDVMYQGPGLSLNQAGETTLLALSAGPTAAQTFIAFTGGTICLAATTHSIVALTAQGVDHNPRTVTVPDINGRLIKQSFINSASDSEITLTVPYTDISWDYSGNSGVASANTGGAAVQLQKWRENGTLLWLYVVAGDTEVIHPGQYTVTVKDCNELQLPGLSDFDAVQITFSIQSYLPTNYDFGFRKIAAVTATSAVVNLAGPYDPRMVAGARVWIYGSTGNDGLYVIQSVTAAVNSIDITVDRAMADSTDDGMMIFGALE